MAGPETELGPEVGVSGDVDPPGVPPGRSVQLRHGTVALRDVAGPAGAPAIIMLHGWTATADINFFRVYGPVSEHFRVLAFDQRGHGRGIRTRAPVRLEDCADDVIALADAIGLERFVVLGYSMGGAVAQLVWRRHSERLLGLVLVATAAHFNVHRTERLSFLGLTGLAAAARVTPAPAHRWVTGQLYLQRKTTSWAPWAVNQARTNNWRPRPRPVPQRRVVGRDRRAHGRRRDDERRGRPRHPADQALRGDP
jgi:3-oxoadipate enol-lactonase